MSWLAMQDKREQLTAVAIAPDLGERYLETIYDTDWLQDHYGPEFLKSAKPTFSQGTPRKMKSPAHAEETKSPTHTVPHGFESRGDVGVCGDLLNVLNMPGLAERNTMIEKFVPKSACVEMFKDVPEAMMYLSEAAVVERAVGERRREFGTVRHCARQALQRIGLPDAIPILPDADGVPGWPSGVVGSMTHCEGYRAAVVARSPM